MAKQKKKRKKNRFEHSKRDKVLYFLMSCIPLAIMLVFVFSINYFGILNKYFYNSTLLLCKPETNGMTVLFYITFFIALIGVIANYGCATTFDIPFKDYIKGKKELAKKYMKFSAVVFTAVLLSFVACAFLQLLSVTNATTQSIENHHLIAADTETQYDEIDNAVLYVKEYYRYAGSGTIRVRTFPHYSPEISVTVNGREKKFKFSDFNYSYSNMKMFLDCIDGSKITVDKTNLDRLLKDSNDTEEINMLFNE